MTKITSKHRRADPLVRSRPPGRLFLHGPSRRGRRLADLGVRPTFKRQHQVACAAANVQHTGFWIRKHAGYARHGSRPPIAVDIHRQQVIQQVVAWRDTSEHAAHPGGGLLLVVNSDWRSTHQLLSASSMAFNTRRWSTSAVILTAPILSGRTK